MAIQRDQQGNSASLNGGAAQPDESVHSLVDSVARINARAHKRLIIGFIAGAVLLLGMAALSLIVIQRMSQRVSDLTQLQENVDRARAMYYLVTAQSHFRAMGLLTEADRYNNLIDTAKLDFSRYLSELEAFSPPEQGDRLQQIRDADIRFADSSARATALHRAGETNEALALHIDDEHPISHELENSMVAIIGENNGLMDAARDSFRSDRGFLTVVVSAFSGVGLSVAAVLAVVLSRSFKQREQEESRLQRALGQQLEELRRSRQRIVASEESLRKRIAELLHGRVQTRLLVVWHRLGEIQKLLNTEMDRARSLTEDIRNEIDQIREQEVREASHLLHPSIVSLGLVPAIRSLAASFERAFSIAIEVDPDLARLDDPVENKIPESIRLLAYRVLEEGLNNIYKHAQATKVEISLAVDSEHYIGIELRDNGRGFQMEQLKPGLGLVSIADRVGVAGGAWRISSELGSGTTLRVRLPQALLVEHAPSPI
ncbi:MAG: hypothetical protein L0177_18840 [Chloroflexi bacterium]|nr:hypothetical protein [Chloroflexota bacterium]